MRLILTVHITKWFLLLFSIIGWICALYVNKRNFINGLDKAANRKMRRWRKPKNILKNHNIAETNNTWELSGFALRDGVAAEMAAPEKGKSWRNCVENNTNLYINHRDITGISPLPALAPILAIPIL